MVETAENAEGSAVAENEKYLDSLQGRLDVMTSSLQALSTSTLDSGFLKGIISGATSAIDIITKLIDAVGVLPTLLGAAGAGFSIFGKGIVGIDKTNNQLLLFGKNLNEIKQILGSFKSGGLSAGIDSIFNGKENVFNTFTEQLNADKTAYESYSKLINNNVTDQQKLNEALSGSSEAFRKWAQDSSNAGKSFKEFSDEQKRNIISLQSQNTSFKSIASIIEEYNSAIDSAEGTSKRLGMTQEEIASSIDGSATSLKSYITGLGGAKASMGGYITSLVGATAKTVALTVASTALNAVLTMSVGLAIGAVITGIGKLITYKDDLAKKVNEVTDSFNQERSSLMENKGSFDDAVKSYERLSSGVSQTGENVSLTASEYEEYLNAVNTIADSTPSMVAGFDAQGNAILKQVDSVNELTDAYNDMIVAQADAILNPDKENDYGGVKDIINDFKNGLSDLENADFKIQDANALEGYLNTDDIDNAIKRVENAGAVQNDRIREKLKDIGFKQKDGESDADFIARSIREDTEKVRAVVDEATSEYEELSNAMDDATQAFFDRELYGDTKLSKANDAVKNIVSSFAESLDTDFYKQFLDDENPAESLEAYVKEISNKFADLGATGQKSLEDAFNFKSQFEKGSISLKEYSEQVQELDDALTDAGFSKGEKTKIMAQLDFEYDGDNLKQFTKDYEEALKKFDGNASKQEIGDWLSTLSGDELDIVLNMELDGSETLEELQATLDLVKALNQVSSIDIQAETKNLEKLNTAIQESNSAIGLTQESIAAIEDRYSSLSGYDPAAIFEKTTTGVRLNTRALNSLEKQYIDTNKAANAKNISVLAQEYENLGEKIKEAEAAGDTNLVDSLTNQQSVIMDSIRQAQMLESAYDGLTSAYKGWVDAQSGGQEGDMYDSILQGMESATELANANKWGNTELQEFIKMFSGEGSMDTATPQQFADSWGSAITKAQRYFAEGTQGIDNFFADIQAKNAELLTETDGKLNFAPNVEVEDVAEALGIAESTVEAIVGMANEYGADIEIGVQTESIDELVAKSQEASDKLKEAFGEDFSVDLDFDYSGLDTVGDKVAKVDGQIQNLKQQRDEINNSSATLEVKQQGIEAVNAAIMAANREKIKLEQPAFMTIDASQVSASLVEPLAKIQEMQSALDNLHALQADESAGITLDAGQLDAAKAKVDECAQAIQSIPSEVKTQLGLEADGSVESIIADFEQGNVTVDVSVDTSKAKSDIAGLELEDKTIGVQVNLAGDDKIASLESKMNAIDNKTINATVSLTGDDKIAALESKMNAIDNKTINATVSVQNSQAVINLQNAINSIQSKTINVAVAVTGTPNVTALQAAINTVQAKTVSVIANVTGTSDVNDLTAAINRVKSKSVSVSASVSGTSSVNSLANAISSVRSKSVTIRATYTTSGEPPKVNGTAHADGTVNGGRAFKQGKWGATESGTALMGELGPEIIVRGDKWFTVGDNGAGFYQYKKGDIIFNHLQSEQLLKNGYVTSNGGRGRAFSEGTAFLEGTAFASLSGGWKPGGIKPSGSGGTTVNNVTNNYNYGSVKSGNTKNNYSSSSSKAKEEADEFSETLDWIEIAIDRIERALDNLDTVASSTYRGWAERTDALNQEMTVTRQEIELQQRAYERYMQEAASVGLSDDWIQKIQNGMIDLETITDEALNDQIKKYREYYEAALDASDSITDLKESLGELADQRFEDIQAQFEGLLNSFDYEQSMIENFIDRAEVDGQFVSKNYYQFLQDSVHQQANTLREEIKQLIAARDEAVNSGAIKEGGEAWDEYNKEINDLTVSVHELGTQWAEYQKAIRETEWDIFDTIQDRITNIADEAQFLIDLMSNKKLFEDNGQLTNEGWATMGLYGEQYNILMNQADRYAEEIKKLEDQMKNDPYLNGDGAFNQDVIDRYYELIEAQQEAILSAEDMKNAIKDLVSEGIDLELEHLDDLIDKYLDALQAQKD